MASGKFYELFPNQLPIIGKSYLGEHIAIDDAMHDLNWYNNFHLDGMLIDADFDPRDTRMRLEQFNLLREIQELPINGLKMGLGVQNTHHNEAYHLATLYGYDFLYFNNILDPSIDQVSYLARRVHRPDIVVLGGLLSSQLNQQALSEAKTKADALVIQVNDTNLDVLEEKIDKYISPITDIPVVASDVNLITYAPSLIRTNGLILGDTNFRTSEKKLKISQLKEFMSNVPFYREEKEEYLAPKKQA